MLSAHQLLALIGRRWPALYDIGPPHGPVLHSHTTARALNPQPLPPYELGAAVAAEFLHTAWLAERFGLDQARLWSDLDDICPPPPKLPKLPPWWEKPRPEPWYKPIPLPDPPPEWFTDYHLGFAARLAVASIDLEQTKLSGLLNEAVSRSLEIIQGLTA